MSREKVTVTLDRAKIAAARQLIDGSSTSQVIDVALTRLIATEQTRRDVEVYLARPLADDELALADLPVELQLGDDDVDYDALMADRDAVAAPRRGEVWYADFPGDKRRPVLGLRVPSVANFDNTFLLTRRGLIRRLSRAGAATMEAACAAMVIAIGCTVR